MPRVQVGYDPRAEALQTTAAPNIQTEQARNDPGASKAFQLAAALGSQGVQQGLAHMTDSVNEQEREKARAYANSMTVDELGKQIKDGKILPSQSPIYAATVQHIYGENSMANFERETLSKIDRGELNFPDQASLDKYLHEQRDSILGGQSQYTIAGFDKKWNQFSQNISAANTKMVDAKFVQHGTQQAQDNLSSIMEETKGKTPEEQAAAITERYSFLRKTGPLQKPEVAREALTNLLASAAAAGNTALIDQLSKTKLDDGVTIGAVVGAKAIAGLAQHAQMQDDRVQRQNVDVEIRPFVEAARKGELTGQVAKDWEALIKKRERYLSTGTIEAVNNSQLAAEHRISQDAQKAKILSLAEESHAAANQAINAAVAGGNYAFLPGLKVVNPTTGSLEDLGEKQKKIAEEAISKQVAANNMPLDKQMQLWSTNGLQNPEWEKQIQAGVSNVASVGWTYDGKNVGQLNPQGQAAIEKYVELANVNPGEAEKYAGSKDNQRLLSDIKFMMEKGGMPNVSDAAAFVNQSHRRGIEQGDANVKRDQVKAAVDDIVNPHFYSGAVNWVSTLFGGNEEVNLSAIGADVRRRAELLVQSGQVPDPKAAVKATVEYFANPAITTKINNTLYFNKDLPTVPQGESTADWMEKFIKEGPGKIADDQKMDGSRIRLETNTNGGYTAWIGGVYLTDKDQNPIVYTKKQVGDWINSRYEADRKEAIFQKNSALSYENWVKRVAKEAGTKTPMPYGSNAGLTYLTSRGAYDYFRKNNALEKPYSELTDILKNKGK